MIKKIIKISFSACIASFLISSCSVQSRVYNKGFQVSLKKNHLDASNEEIVSVKNDTYKVTDQLVLQSESFVATEISKTEEKEIVNNNVSSLINSEALFESNKTIKIKEVKNHDSFIVSKSVIKNNLNQFRSKESVIQKKVPNKGMSDEMILLTILCFLIPFLAVGLATDWDITKVLICLILSLFFWIPGVIYALLVVLNKI